MIAVRVKKLKVTVRGERGLIVSIPRVQASDLGLSAGDNVSLYRGVIGGEDVLILANSEKSSLGIDDEVAIMAGRTQIDPAFFQRGME